MENDLKKNKHQIIKNLEILKAILENIEKTGGFEDFDETIYNEIFELVEETKAIKVQDELYLIIERAKAIESKFEQWEEREGFSDYEIKWPNI